MIFGIYSALWLHSQATFVQLEDSIAPAMPTGLDGTFPTSNTLQLTWTPNTESDVSGYRVFVANSRNGEFMQVTSSPVTNEQFVYNIDPKFMVDSIFVKILAADFRDNFSDYSKILALARPDVVAPSNPLLHHVVPTPRGIELGYRFSESKDVSHHEFQRKPKNGGSWETIQTVAVDEAKQFIDGNQEQFLDEDPLRRKEYLYRLLAIDASNNIASSKVMKARPFDNGERGQITDFQLNVNYTLLDVKNIENPEAYKYMMDMMSTYEYYGTINLDELKYLLILNVITKQEHQFLLSSKPYEINNFLQTRFRKIWGDDLIPEIELSWSYDAANDQLIDYQIFRSVKGSALSLYKTLPVEELSGNYWIDTDTKPGRRYVYQIMARHLGGGFSKRSKPLSVKLPK